MRSNPSFSGKFVLKYTFDKIVALCGLLLLSPILVSIIFAIWIEGLIFPRSRGPSIIHDIRISQHRAFPLWKFRTFYCEDDILHQDKRGTSDFINERAVTKVGYVLRKYYFDELPQLLNILFGQMSFVGPRPTPQLMYIRTLKAGYKSKRLLRAGLGGPVQYLKGKWRQLGNYLNADEALIDEYASRSPLGIVTLDLLIMWRTFLKICEGDGLEHPYR